MTQFRSNIIRAGFDVLYFTGAHQWLRPLLGGVGAIFMLHHVRPKSDAAFQPNRGLEITPEFLRETLTHVRATDVDIVTLDEMHRRLTSRDFSRRFACFTFDDGYRDNRDHALPVFAEFDAPFTVYVASDFAQGAGRLWWVALERVIAHADKIDGTTIGYEAVFDTRTTTGKKIAFDALHAWLRSLPIECEVREAVDALCARHGIDDSAISRDLCMSWSELRAFADNPLVTIGAHTISHCNLANTSDGDAAYEMADSRARIADALARPVDHFAYPYGDRAAAGAREFALARKLGYKTAVTTRPGMVFPQNAGHMTALPRISLNGHYQDRRFLNVLTSGAATAVWNGFRRVDAA